MFLRTCSLFGVLPVLMIYSLLSEGLFHCVLYHLIMIPQIPFKQDNPALADQLLNYCLAGGIDLSIEQMDYLAEAAARLQLTAESDDCPF